MRRGLILLLAAATVGAQPVVMLVDQGPLGVNSVANGGTINMVAEAIGAANTATLTFSYRGSGSLAVGSIDRTGSNEFSITAPSLPATLAPNQSINVPIRFVPGSGNRAMGRLTFTVTETGPEGPPAQGTVAVNLAGFAPELVFSFTLPGANALPLADGTEIAFPATPLNTSTTATIAILNRGSAFGTVSGISATGQAFQLAGVPLPPINLDPAKELRFTVSFTATQREAQPGTLKVDYAGRSVTFRLRGSGAGPTWVYELLQTAGEKPVAAGQTITVADTAVGERASLAMRVRNTGNAEGTIQSINVLGPGFQLADLPFFPLTLAPGAGVTFTIVFAPGQPGKAAGRLRVGNDTFELAGAGLGWSLSYSYSIAGATAAVQNNGPVLFSALPVGQSSKARFVTANTGNTPAVISAIFVSGGGTTFSLEDMPELPLTLEPGGSAGFLVVFAPAGVGVSQALLRVGGHSFDLIGSATAPTPLAAVTLEGPRGPQQPLQQPAYTLSIAEPYPLNLAGALTLTFNSEVFTNDATVQFATGGRTVNFTIPAGSTRAVFPNNETQIRLQTGSVAGTITLTPVFATESGINLTPAAAPAISLTIPQAAPQLVSAQLGAKTATGFTLLVTGYSTGRTLSQIELQVTPATGGNISNPRVTLNVEAAFLSWYQNAQSQQFGSLFTAQVPVSLEGSVAAGSLVEAIQSVGVSVVNNLGSSGVRVVEFR